MSRTGRGLPALALAAWLLPALLAGCASAVQPPPEPPPRPAAEPLDLPRDDAPYVVDPLRGYPRTVDAESRRAIEEAFARLLEASDLDGARRVATDLLADDPGLHPARLLLAQVDFAGGDRAGYPEIVQRLVATALEVPGYIANQLLLGRAAELAGDVPVAYSAFRAIAPHDALALRRTGELHARAIEVVANRLRDELRRGRVEEAEGQLGWLKEWAPAEPVTFEAAREIAVARGDLAAELAAVRWLAERRPGDRSLLERRADLELSVGDPGAGLELAQALATSYPQDPAAAERLASAKFRWRLSLLPEGVQATAGKPQLTRADLAVLLYWLVPNVRYGRPASGRIATDVLDHPQQEEIVRVVNLGLMEVEGTLHRFSPAVPARRSTALRSLVRLLSLYGQGVACTAGVAGNPQPSQGTVCRTAAACGLLASEADCLPQAAVSGAEVVDWIRQSLELLGAS